MKPLIGLAIGAALLTVAGCAPDPRHHLSEVVIRRDGSAVVMASCSDIEFDHLSMEQRNLKSGEPWNQFWSSDHRRSLDEGDTISTDDKPLEGDAVSVPQLHPNDQLRIYLDLAAPEGGRPVAASVFFIGDSGLSDTQWLHADGSLTSQPCS